jgi:peptide/nickel transport system permease protein
MSADTRRERRTFEEIDWDEVDAGAGGLSRRLFAQVAAVGLWAGALLWDYFLVPEGDSLVPFLQWDVSSIDFLFVLTLVLGAFNVLLPLADNPRMTRYYWRQFKKNDVAVASAAYLAVVFAVGLVGPVLVAELWGPPQLHLGRANLPPVGFTAAPSGTEVTGTWAHPLGTDHQGKDILKLMVYGMRVSMEVGLISMFIAVTIALSVGTSAAYFGGVVDEVLMRYVDIQQTFPSFLLLIFLVYLFDGSLLIIVLLYGFLSWGGIGRLVRSEALQRREEEYVRAAENAGASEWWIIRRHLMPNVSSTAITAATLLVPSFILGEAALSFIGLGDPDVYSWGQVIAAGRDSLATAPWIATVPGLFLFCTVLAMNFTGDALRDALDPRQES